MHEGTKEKKWNVGEGKTYDQPSELTKKCMKGLREGKKWNVREGTHKHARAHADKRQ